MSFEIDWDKQSRNFLRKIEKKDAQRIIKKINSITESPFLSLETLVYINAYKLRIGDYRALIDLDFQNKIIRVILIGLRKNIYKHLDKFKD